MIKKDSEGYYTKELPKLVKKGLKNSDIEILKEETEKFLIKTEKPVPDSCLALASLLLTHTLEIINRASP